MKNLLIYLVINLTMVVAFADHHESSSISEVEYTVKSFNKSYAANDVEGYFKNFDLDAILYFYGNRWEVPIYHAYWKDYVTQEGGAVEEIIISDMRIKVLSDNNVAVATYFVENHSRSPEGDISEEKAYETDVLQKINGEWKIVSLHYSVIVPE